MFGDKTLKLAKRLIDILDENNLMIVTAESCTGGLIAGALTAVPGSSSVVHGGYVTYANEAKTGMIGVSADLIEAKGAVSKQVAIAMAKGALEASKMNIAIAVTGIAGPGGETDDKPVGLVHIACATGTGTCHRQFDFGDIGRDGVRSSTIDAAIELVIKTVKNQP